MSCAEKMEENFLRVNSKIKLMFYKGIFGVIKEREGSLSAMEAFSLEVIDMLNRPTISQFADFLSISQSNATYKVNCLIKKGYIGRENSQTDHREYYLTLTEKYRNYIGIMNSYEHKVAERVRARFTEEEQNRFSEMLAIIADELMPECSE